MIYECIILINKIPFLKPFKLQMNEWACFHHY